MQEETTRSSGPVLYVDRAYLDCYITPEWIATIGRQPGTDGPGSNLRNNVLDNQLIQP